MPERGDSPESASLSRPIGVLQIARRCNSAGDLPDVSKCFREVAQSIHASHHHATFATLHGVVFDILVGGEHRALRLSFPMTIAGWLAEP
jgi:hypothetical protein